MIISNVEIKKSVIMIRWVFKEFLQRLNPLDGLKILTYHSYQIYNNVEYLKHYVTY